MPAANVNKILKLPLRWLGAALAVVVLAISALFHGLSPVPSSNDATTAVGTVVHGGPWDVTIVGGRILNSQPNLTTANPADRWFGVVAIVDVTANDSIGNVSNLVRVSGVAGLQSAEPAHTVLVRDGGNADLPDVGFLNPGMPESVEFLWEQTASAPIPSTVDVTVNSMKLVPDTLNGNVLTWMDLGPPTVVTAPVVDKRIGTGTAK